MNKSFGTALIAWNVLLTALVAWALFRSPSATNAAAAVAANDSSAVIAPAVVRDTTALSGVRIAYYQLDSVLDGYELFEDRKGFVLGEGKRLEEELSRKMAHARKRQKELMEQDVYSTQAQREAAERELQGYAAEIQELQARSQQNLDEIQLSVLQETNKAIDDQLAAINATAGFDLILRVQEPGDIWCGNTALDITGPLIAALNADYRARKAAAKK
ncbi:MAG: OmpH family outer membrane protein [Flavobacteriales bacterium]|nr:OmpH family outer membrane protein [Flavobacteriales bacterium]